jgi:hypothetical protein
MSQATEKPQERHRSRLGQGKGCVKEVTRGERIQDLILHTLSTW